MAGPITDGLSDTTSEDVTKELFVSPKVFVQLPNDGSGCAVNDPKSVASGNAGDGGSGRAGDSEWARTLKDFHWSLVGILSGLLGIALLSWWLWGSYFGVDVFASLSFVGDDSWCSKEGEAVGVHCFGDYSAIRIESLITPLTGPEGVYPPSSRILRATPWLVDRLFGFRAGLILFLAVSAAAALVPAVWASLRLPYALRPVVLTTLGIATVPFLSLVDRGQLLAIAVPSIFAFMLLSMRQDAWLALAALAPAVAIKPQFAVVVVLFAVLRQWRLFFVGSVGAALIVLAPFIIFGRDLKAALGGWIESASNWAASVPLTQEWPSNLSFASGVRRTIEAVVMGPAENVLGNSQNSLLAVADSAYVAGAVALSALVVGVLVLLGRHLDRLLLLAALLAVGSFTIGVSWIYYSCIALPLAALTFRSATGQAIRMSQGRWARVAGVMLIFSIIVSLTPVLVPLSLDAGKAVPNAMVLVISMSWLTFIVVTGISAVAERPKSRGTSNRGEE